MIESIVEVGSFWLWWPNFANIFMKMESLWKVIFSAVFFHFYMSFANVSVRPKNIVEFVMSVDKDDIMSDGITIGISVIRPQLCLQKYYLKNKSWQQLSHPIFFQFLQADELGGLYHMGKSWKTKDWTSHFWQSYFFIFYYEGGRNKRRYNCTETGTST